MQDTGVGDAPSVGLKLTPEGIWEVSCPVRDAHNPDGIAVDPVQHHIPCHHDHPDSRPEIRPLTPGLWREPEPLEVLVNLEDQPVRRFGAIHGDEQADLPQISRRGG